MAKRTVSLVECSVRSWATHEGVLPWEMLEHIVNGTARGERVAEQIDFDQQVDQRSDEWATWRTWLAWRRARHEEHKLAGLPRDVKGAREMWHTLVNAATRIRDHSLRYTGYDDPTLMRDTLEMPPRQAAFVLCSAPKHATYVMGTLDEVARVPFGPSPEHVPAVPPPAVGEDRFRQEDFIATCAESQSWDDVRILLAQTQSRFGDAPASPSTWVPAEAWEQVESFGGYVVLSDAAFDRLRAPDATARQRRCELESAVIPTAYAGRGCKAWELSTRVPWGSQHVAGTSLKRLNADAWASLMGAPLHSIDGVRRCMDMLSAESAKHAAIAQGQHAGVVQAVMEHAFEGVEPTNGTNYTFVDVYSGIGVGLEGIRAMDADFEIVAAAEAIDSCRKAYRAGWRNRLKGRPFHVWAQSRATGKNFEHLQGVDGAIGGFRCAPWSRAQIFPPEGRSREQERTLAIEELRGVVRNVCSARPQRIIWESSADVLDSPEWWEKMKAAIAEDPNYTWKWQVICPRQHLGEKMVRRRLWIVGYRRVASAGTSAWQPPPPPPPHLQVQQPPAPQPSPPQQPLPPPQQPDEGVAVARTKRKVMDLNYLSSDDDSDYWDEGSEGEQNGTGDTPELLPPSETPPTAGGKGDSAKPEECWCSNWCRVWTTRRQHGTPFCENCGGGCACNAFGGTCCTGEWDRCVRIPGMANGEAEPVLRRAHAGERWGGQGLEGTTCSMRTDEEGDTAHAFLEAETKAAAALQMSIAARRQQLLDYVMAAPSVKAARRRQRLAYWRENYMM